MSDSDEFVEETDVTRHDEGVSFEVMLQNGSSSDRTRVKAKLKTTTDEEFAAKKDDFLEEVREGAHEAKAAHDDVFHDDE